MMFLLIGIISLQAISVVVVFGFMVDISENQRQISAAVSSLSRTIAGKSALNLVTRSTSEDSSDLQ